MTPNQIYSKLKNTFGDKIISLTESPEIESNITIAHQHTKEICMFLRDDKELQFDYLSMLSGMDYKDNLGVVYHLFSTTQKHKITLKTIINREKPNTPTVERIWKTANWHERETYDMFGINFEGHPDLERILCPDDWIGFPLRKDYIAPTEYNGIDATPNSIKN